MEAKNFLEADYLDIVFEYRNKAYGSYYLRKNYTRRIKKAGLFAILGVVSIVLLSFAASHHNGIIAPKTTGTTTITDISYPPPPLPKLPPSPPPPPSSVRTKAITVPTIVSDNVAIIKEMPVAHELINSNPGISNNTGDSTNLDSGPVSGKAPVVTISTATAMEPVRIVDQMPQFLGDLDKYLADNIVYPENAKSAGIQGRVVIQFVVNEDGTVTNLNVMRGIGGGCDEEAFKVIGRMPKWKPGKNNGVPVKVYYNQAIYFQLDR